MNPIHGLSPASRPHYAPALTRSPVLFGRKLPKATDYQLVIAGGGIAGMTAAYQAQQAGIKTLLLEAKDVMGGNTKTEVSEDGIPYPVGASVLAVGDSRQLGMFKDLDINLDDPGYLIRRDVTHVNGEWVSVDPKKPNQTPLEKAFSKAVDYLVQELFNLLGGPNGGASFPLRNANPKLFDMDKKNTNFREGLKRFSNSPAMKAIEQETGVPNLGAEVHKFLEVNFRSDVSEYADKVSALAGSIDQGADQGERYVLPGGNFFIIKKMMEYFDKLGDKRLVTLQTHSPVVEIKEGKNAATIIYQDKEGRKQKVTASQVLLGMPSHRMPDVLQMPRAAANFLRSIKRGAYAMLNLSLNASPLQSNTYIKFPYATWVADIIQMNQKRDPFLPPGEKVPSVVTCYVPIPRSLKQTLPRNPDQLANKLDDLKETVINEICATLPEVRPAIKTAKLTYYPESMSAPTPGQMKKFVTFNRQVTPHVRTIHSDLSGVFACRGAIDEAWEGVIAVKANLEKQSAQNKG